LRLPPTTPASAEPFAPNVAAATTMLAYMSPILSSSLIGIDDKRMFVRVTFADWLDAHPSVVDRFQADPWSAAGVRAAIFDAKLSREETSLLIAQQSKSTQDLLDALNASVESARDAASANAVGMAQNVFVELVEQILQGEQGLRSSA
jgi:hypothetical protein